MTTKEQRLNDLRLQLRPLKAERDVIISEINEIEDEIYEIEHPDEYPDYEPPEDESDDERLSIEELQELGEQVINLKWQSPRAPVPGEDGGEV